MLLNSQHLQKHNFKPLLFLMIFASSTQLNAQTFFFERAPQKPSGYYNNNEEIRSERMDASKHEPDVKAYSKQHQQVAGFLNSKNAPKTADAKWVSENLLQIGVIRRSFADKEYAQKICGAISAFNLPNKGKSVRIIFLPSLVANNRLELLVKHQCS